MPSTAFILPALLLLACAACADAPAAGPWKPTRTVEFIVAAGPGGGSDQLARKVQSIIQKHRLLDSVSVKVTNMGDGAGSEAFVHAKGAAGNPHKLTFATNNVWLLPLVRAVGYSSSDLRPVAVMALDEFMLWVNATAPYRDSAGFLSAARKGKRLAIAGTQAKDTDQVLVRQIERIAGVSFTYVAYRSGNEVAVQLAGGHVAANVNNPQENVAQWKAGNVRPVCVFAPTRLVYTELVTAEASWADIPTCKESGLAIERYQMPRTVWLPGGVTDEQVAFYRDLMAKVRATKEWKTWLRTGAQTDMFLTGPKLADYIAEDEKSLRDEFTRNGWLAR